MVLVMKGSIVPQINQPDNCLQKCDALDCSVPKLPQHENLPSNQGIPNLVFRPGRLHLSLRFGHPHTTTFFIYLIYLIYLVCPIGLSALP